MVFDTLQAKAAEGLLSFIKRKRPVSHTKRARSTQGWGWEVGGGGGLVGFARESLPFCAGVQFSRDSLHSFNDGMKYEKIEGCEQSIDNIFFYTIDLQYCVFPLFL